MGDGDVTASVGFGVASGCSDILDVWMLSSDDALRKERRCTSAARDAALRVAEGVSGASPKGVADCPASVEGRAACSPPRLLEGAEEGGDEGG